MTLPNSENQESILNALLEGTPDFIQLLDLDGRFKYVNRLDPDLKPEDIIGQSVFDLVPEIQRQSITKAFCDTKEQLKVQIVENHNEFGFWQNIFYPIIYDGSLKEIMLIARNISNLKETEQRNQKLAQAYKEIEQFAYFVSHDQRNPLINIQVYLELIQDTDGTVLSESSKEHIQHMLEIINRQFELIESLMQLSKVGTRTDTLIETIDLNEVLQDVVRTIFILEFKDTVTIYPLPKIYGIKSEIFQLFQNLLHNSFKYRSKNRDLQVVIDAKMNETEFEITITDNGIGFSPDKSEAIFQSFKRYVKDKEIPGSGLGLSICKKVVESYNGNIYAKSQPDLGAVFTIIFPNSMLWLGK